MGDKCPSIRCARGRMFWGKYPGSKCHGPNVLEGEGQISQGSKSPRVQLFGGKLSSRKYPGSTVLGEISGGMYPGKMSRGILPTAILLINLLSMNSFLHCITQYKHINLFTSLHKLMKNCKICICNSSINTMKIIHILFCCKRYYLFEFNVIVTSIL